MVKMVYNGLYNFIYIYIYGNGEILPSGYDISFTGLAMERFNHDF